MASPSLQIKLEGGGRGGTGDPTREILRRNKALRKSERRERILTQRFCPLLVPGGAGRERRRRDPSTIASIPSRYQVFFHRSTQAKGFQSQSSRFQEHINVDDSPGPGSYTTPHSSLNTHPTSSSTAGSGGLFQAPIAVAPEERGATGDVSPSPTSYHPSHCHTRTSHAVSAEAAFKSRSKRSSLSSSCTLTPSPGHYNGPGPADYSPHTHPLSTTNPSSHAPQQHRQKLRISAPALPLPPLPPSPGPGHYETKGSIVRSESMKIVKPSGCGFTSNVDRWGSEVKRNHDNEPGPGSYDLVDHCKKSYLYNLHTKWI
ncbi:O(6)-methylguanine-induced apoptosis 2 [Geodia barretti]|uniref:O(6)-methylguanine-induced apoptosis 2 n=1 Tax=Geodia barretti TaxID=519541 RepID=A0AA35SLB6_GEOBA|nr:O(6)-methylguanine-induced apoptosis 2 [Geodia barretti]